MDGQNYDSQDRASIAASRGKNRYVDRNARFLPVSATEITLCLDASILLALRGFQRYAVTNAGNTGLITDHTLGSQYLALSKWQCNVCDRLHFSALFRKRFFVQLCSKPQNFNCHSASRGLSATADLLVSCVTAV